MISSHCFLHQSINQTMPHHCSLGLIDLFLHFFEKMIGRCRCFPRPVPLTLLSDTNEEKCYHLQKLALDNNLKLLEATYI